MDGYVGWTIKYNEIGERKQDGLGFLAGTPRAKEHTMTFTVCQHSKDKRDEEKHILDLARTLDGSRYFTNVRVFREVPPEEVEFVETDTSG